MKIKELPLHFLTLTSEEIIYFCVAILAIVTFGSGFTRFFASSFANPPPKEDVGFDFNPFTNLDIVGTIVFFLGGFGWGRQVDDQKIRFKKQKLGWLILSLVAPFASMVLALTAAYIRHFLWTDRVIEILVEVSVTVTAYHLLPIPPLAASRLIYLVLPGERIWRLFSRAGPFIILAMVLFDRLSGVPFLREMMAPVVDAVGRFAAYH
ncbi:MAG: hypothetical protein JSU72_18685 [Deltaproteobacteria bacterium]|nr:MAG: hypothetical protein JSU72_18685 [Deltaproteobacteria bacterium]